MHVYNYLDACVVKIGALFMPSLQRCRLQLKHRVFVFLWYFLGQTWYCVSFYFFRIRTTQWGGRCGSYGWCWSRWNHFVMTPLHRGEYVDKCITLGLVFGQYETSVVVSVKAALEESGDLSLGRGVTLKIIWKVWSDTIAQKLLLWVPETIRDLTEGHSCNKMTNIYILINVNPLVTMKCNDNF